MANLIQIKRSLSTATAPSLANGELAFTANGDHLFIGSNGASITIAGKFSPGVLTANQALVANGTGFIDEIKVANATIGKIFANGAFGTENQILTSNSTGGLFFAPPAVLTLDGLSDVAVTSASAGQILVANAAGTFRNLSLSGDITVDANGLVTISANSVALGADTTGNYVAEITAGNGLSGNAASESNVVTLAVVAGTSGGLTSNSSGVFVVASDGLVANGSGLHVGQANGITVAADTVGVLTGSTLSVNASGVHVNSALSITDLSLSGNLTVLGTLTTIDTTNLTVQDSIIELANGNGTTDILDIGLYGQFGATGTKYTGLFRDATDGIYKLFTGSQTEPTTTVDTAAVGYTTATLQAFLTSGGLVSNSTAVTLTSNSTLAVAITANTLSLSTALPGTSGGTGLNTYTTEDILVANSSNGFRKLGVAADGFVLQSNGTAVVYSTLDGGTF